MRSSISYKFPLITIRSHLEEEISLSDIDEYPLRAFASEEDDIVSSFASNGQLAPIKLRLHPHKQNRFQVIYGNRRLAAARKLGWKTIRAEIVVVDEAQSLLMALSENLDRRDFSDYEKASIIEKIHRETCKPYSEIAAMIHRSEAFVYQHIAMLRLLPPDLSKHGDAPRLLASLTEKHARILMKIEDPVERWNTAKLVVNAGLSVRELQKFVGSPHHRKNHRATDDLLRNMILEMVEGWNRGDMRPQIRARSAKTFTLFDDIPPLRKMERNDADDHNTKNMQKFRICKMCIDDLNIRVIGNAAFATMYISYNLVRGESKQRITSRVSLFFERIIVWKIVHEHWSMMNSEDLFSGILSPATLTTKYR